MTREQIMARLAQEYARRREDNLRLFEQRREDACARCPGLRDRGTPAQPFRCGGR